LLRSLNPMTSPQLRGALPAELRWHFSSASFAQSDDLPAVAGCSTS
jgi:hypothetical protein